MKKIISFNVSFFHFSSIKQRFMIPLIFAVVLVMSILSFFQYHTQANKIEISIKEKLDFIADQASLNFANPLWNYNDSGINDTAKAILVDNEVASIELYDIYGLKKYHVQLSKEPYSKNYLQSKKKDVLYDGVLVGQLVIQITNYYRYKDLQSNLYSTILSTFLIITILIITITIVSKYITKPISSLVDGVDIFASGNLSHRLPISTHDEIGFLSEKFNTMASRIEALIFEREHISAELKTLNETLYVQNVELTNQIRERKNAEEQLEHAHAELELKVKERTAQLSQSNESLAQINNELMTTLKELQLTQDQLIQSKKLAALGSLVAGIAHEINTPVGISVTGITYLEKEIQAIQDKLELGVLKRSDMELFLKEVQPLAQTIFKNLSRADSLIRSFKLVAADQTADEKRLFNFREYLEELVISLSPMFKKTKHSIFVNCPDDIILFSYPGTLAQIVTNFITNSIKHAFEPDSEGNINISVTSENHWITLKYSDDGNGMDEESIERVFDPFYTTKRGASGSIGLGMNLVYNLVTQNLNGSIRCDSKPLEGTTFTIKFPYSTDLEHNPLQ